MFLDVTYECARTHHADSEYLLFIIALEPIFDALNLPMSSFSFHSVKRTIVDILYTCFHILAIVLEDLKEIQSGKNVGDFLAFRKMNLHNFLKALLDYASFHNTII